MSEPRTIIEKVPWWNARLYIGLLSAMSAAAIWGFLSEPAHPLAYYFEYPGFLFVGVAASAILLPAITLAALYLVTIGKRVILYTQDGCLSYLIPFVSKTQLDQICDFDICRIKQWTSEKECIAIRTIHNRPKYIDVGILENKYETLEKLKQLIS